MIGPFVGNGPALVGDYAYMWDGVKFSYPEEAAKALAYESYVAVHGCVGKVDSQLAKCEEYNQTEVKEAVKDSHLILLALGTGKMNKHNFHNLIKKLYKKNIIN